MGSVPVLAQELSVSPGIDKPLGTFEPKTGSSVLLRGFRSETVSFLLRLKGEGCHQRKITKLQHDEPRLGKDGGELAVELSELPSVTTIRPSYRGAPVGAQLDPVIPLKEGSLLCSSPKGQWYLGEIPISPSTEPGTYSGQIALKDSPPGDGIQVKVTVGHALLPARPRLPIYSELSSFHLLKGHYGAWHDGEEVLAREYGDVMMRHRVFPIKNAIVAPPILTDGEKERLDLERAPTPSQSFASVVLNSRSSWAMVDLPTAIRSGTTLDQRRRYYRAMEATVPKLPWADRAFLYLWDEPKEKEFEALAQEARLVRDAAPSIKIMVTTPWSARFAPYVDIWCPVIEQFGQQGFAPASQYAAEQAGGKSVWWYVSCTSHGCEDDIDSGYPDLVIDRPAVAVRTIGALSVVNRIDAFLYYSVNNSYRNYPNVDPWSIPWEFSGNGDGTLFYPGRPGEHGFTSHQPVASLRLKLLREASYDADYIALIQSLPIRPLWFETELKALAPSTTAWSRSYEAYQRFHDKIWTYIEESDGGKR